MAQNQAVPVHVSKYEVVPTLKLSTDSPGRFGCVLVHISEATLRRQSASSGSA